MVHYNLAMRVYFLLIISVFVLVSCNGFEELTMQGQPDVNIKGIGSDGIALELVVTINNPNSRSFKVKQASFDIFVNDNNVGNTQMSKAIKIEANSTEEYTFPMNVKLNGEDLSINLILSTIFQSRIKLRIKGDVKAGSFLINQSFPVDWEENVSL